MTKNFLLLLLLLITTAGCQKEKEHQPGFGVYGLEDVTMVNDGFSIISIPLSISYTDDPGDLKEYITLSVSGLPADVELDTAWQGSGYPPFTTTLRLRAKMNTYVKPGQYTVKVTAKSTGMGTKELKFYLTVVKAMSCASGLVGKYDYCFSYYNHTAYSDSVYEDKFASNIIWFANFMGTGKPVYGVLNCYSLYLTIPPQTIDGVTYEGGNVCSEKKQMWLYVYRGTERFALTMH